MGSTGPGGSSGGISGEQLRGMGQKGEQGGSYVGVMFRLSRFSNILMIFRIFFLRRRQ